MKSRLLFLALLYFVPNAHAGLLDSLKLEDALRSRIEATLAAADPRARASVRIEYNKYQGELPGTHLAKETDFTPTQIEKTDIKNIEIDVYSELEQIPEETMNSLYAVIPIERAKLKINFKQIPARPIDLSGVLDAKSVSQIANQSLTNFAQILVIALLGSILFVMVVFFLMSIRKLKTFKEQMALLADAVAKNSGASAPLPATANIGPSREQSSNQERSEDSIQKLSAPALRELFADCYWTETDGYAHWIWKKLDPQQRAQLFMDFKKMKDYSLFFVNTAPVRMLFHEHPFYLQPQDLSGVGQDDLLNEIKKDLSKWHLLSPLRQEFIGLDIEAKLAAVQKPPSSQSWSFSRPSEDRKLKTNFRWGDLSLQDESLIFNNPSMVPDVTKSSIRTLVWLAQKDSNRITQVLAQFDARSLAMAWVGPADLLAKLEQHLPEKKLRILQSYRLQISASRSSASYSALVQEGLKNEAA